MAGSCSPLWQADEEEDRDTEAPRTMEGDLIYSTEDIAPSDTSTTDVKYKRNVWFSAGLSVILLASIIAAVNFLPIYEDNEEPTASREVTTGSIVVEKNGQRVRAGSGDTSAEDDADESVPSHTLAKSSSTLAVPLPGEENPPVELDKRVLPTARVTATGDSHHAVRKAHTVPKHRHMTHNRQASRNVELSKPPTVFKNATGATTKNTRILACFISGDTPTSMDALPPPGICDYLIYTRVGYARGRLRFAYPSTFKKFREQARVAQSTSVRSGWGVALNAAEAMSGQSGVWGEHRQEFGLQVHRLLVAYGISCFGLADVHTTAADFIDTANDYLDFYKSFRGILEKFPVPLGPKPTLFFGMRVLGMFYSNRDAFRDRVGNVLQFVDIFIYQTHVSRITKMCVSVFPSNRYYPGIDDQDSFDDALRTLTPPLVYRDDFHLLLSISLSLLRFSMKGPDIEEIRRPCKSMVSLPFKVYCNTTGFSEDSEDELQIGVYRFNERRSLVDTFETPDVIEFKMNDVMREYQVNGLDIGFAAFYLEHEDYRGECGNSFARLRMMSKCLRNFV
ncbi:uncharacterized protein [Dermacentor albipictus]|uniref:uncharacterized protein isoform X3 n=1 Tax=Dermacentor albipictus TaxID=60249 RepID=UPI0038FCF0E8